MKLRKLILLILFGSILILTIRTNFEVDELAQKHCEYSNVQAFTLDQTPITEWQNYKDSHYKYMVIYPMGWDFQKTINQEGSLVDAEAILQRVSFFGAEGFIDIDVWLSQGMMLSEWLEWYERTRNTFQGDGIQTKIAGNKAVMFFEDGSTTAMLSTFFIEGDHVYRLWYTISSSINGLNVYKKC